MSAASSTRTKGFLAALAAYLMWGVMPIYWQFLKHVDALVGADQKARLFAGGKRGAFEELDGIEKRAMTHGHDEVDGIEIFLAGEASREIGGGIDRGIECGTEGAKESQVGFAKRGWEFETNTNEIGNRYVVSERAQLFGRDAGHFGEFFFFRSACFCAARSIASLAL